MNENKDKPERTTVSVDAKFIKSGRDTVVAGSDVTSGDSYGDTNTQTHNNIIVRGVETTEGDLGVLLNALRSLDEAIVTSDLKEEDKEVATHNANTLRDQMTQVTDKKPNDIILTTAAEALYKYGPAITGALVAAFTTPLGGMIATVAGTRALNFYRSVKVGNLKDV